MLALRKPEVLYACSRDAGEPGAIGVLNKESLKRVPLIDENSERVPRVQVARSRKHKAPYPCIDNGPCLSGPGTDSLVSRQYGQPLPANYRKPHTVFRAQGHFRKCLVPGVEDVTPSRGQTTTQRQVILVDKEPGSGWLAHAAVDVCCVS